MRTFGQRLVMRAAWWFALAGIPSLSPPGDVEVTAARGPQLCVEASSTRGAVGSPGTILLAPLCLRVPVPYLDAQTIESVPKFLGLTYEFVASLLVEAGGQVGVRVDEATSVQFDVGSTGARVGISYAPGG